MRFTYDRESDILMIHLADMARFHASRRDETSGAILDLAEDGTVLGIELMGALKSYGEEALASLPTEFAPLLSLAEAAEISGIDAQALKKAAQEGRLSARKVGRNWTTSEAEVMSYKASRKHRGPHKEE